MGREEELAALVALLRDGGRGWARYVTQVRAGGGPLGASAEAVLEQELGLLAYQAQTRATEQIMAWRARGYKLISALDPDYPANLRVVDSRPPLLFVAGALSTADQRSVAVIGTRRPSGAGRRLAESVAVGLSAAGYSVFSGLAAGVDTAAHTAVLERGRRTVAVIGTGLDHAYPRGNAALQERIAACGAVISQFWPEAAPTRQSFPTRNALMSGLTLASVIVEASPTSGTRVQARHALSQGRTVVLMQPVLSQDWAQELVERPGVAVAESVDDVLAALGR